VVEPVNIVAKPGTGGKSALDLALLGTVFGLVIGVGGAFGREYINTTFSTEESARRQLRLPVLGSIPEERK
jgi:capsular polysaccharide biosynthesis protein